MIIKYLTGGEMVANQGQELESVLSDVVDQAKAAFEDDLLSIVLFGSAAEDKLRPLSDVNLMFVLERFESGRADSFRETLRMAHSAVRASVMFMLKEELPIAAELFAVKFNDIQSRHRVLFGADLLAGHVVDEVELRRRLREVLLNLSIRLRERYVLISLHEEQLVTVIAKAAPPLRASALALLRLRGETASSPREALEKLVAKIGDSGFSEAVAILPQARQTLHLAPGVGGATLLALSRLASHLRFGLEAEESKGSGAKQ
jgi:predicted nucleotidyltransferase